MSDFRGPNDPKSLWKEQAVTVAVFTPEDLRARALKHARTVRLRNVIEYIAGVLVIGCFGAMAIVLPDLLERIASGLIIAGVVVALWQLHQRAAAAAVPAGGDLLAFQREQLSRQLAALKSVPVWYLGPLVPGMGLLLFARYLEARPSNAWPVLVAAAWVVACFGVVWLLNHLAARSLARQIEDLDRIGDPR